MKRYVIFCNGDLARPDRVAASLRSDDIILCADGGANHAMALGLLPHAVIGDMDSISPSNLALLEEDGIQINRHNCNKDATDFELTLQHALHARASEILMVGALGNRLDHTLANILACARSDLADTRVSMIDGLTSATLLQGRKTLELSGSPGDTVSLIPLSPTVKGVSSQGLKWTLRSSVLHFGRTLTMSNELETSQAEVSIESGTLLVVHTAGE